MSWKRQNYDYGIDGHCQVLGLGGGDTGQKGKAKALSRTLMNNYYSSSQTGKFLDTDFFYNLKKQAKEFTGIYITISACQC